MMRMLFAATFSMLVPAAVHGQPLKTTRVLQLFNFNEPVGSWSALVLPKAKEPPASIELSKLHAADGKSTLKITFAGGSWPTITTTKVLDDWMPYHTFRADLYVSRPCVVGFQALQEKSTREPGWDGSISRWVKTVIAQPGKNEVSAAIHPNEYSAINGNLGKVVRFEIFMYQPQPGESIFVDNLRLTGERLPAPKIETQFRVLGTHWTVSGVQELGKKLAKDWTPPTETTVEQVEKDFQQHYEKLKQRHPNSVLAVFRDGDKGFDPTNPDRPYAGWKDAYWSSHGPDGMTVDRAENFGKHASQEIFMRHRSPLMRVELGSIPKGAKILAAKMIVVRANDFYDKERDPRKNPNMWVAEACNRPWEEYDVNAYQYARGKFWKNVGGMHWDGNDPDFLPVYLAHGPGGGKVSAWDFTEAVKFWTDGKHPNHGFMLHGDARDWLGRAHYREAAELRNRPALLVIYDQK